MARKRTTPRPQARRSAAAPAAKTEEPLPPIIYAQASPHSIGGVSMFEAGAMVSEENAPSFMSDEETIWAAAARLEGAGFDVLNISPLMINIAGRADLYRRAFGTQLVTEERSVIKEGAKEDTATFVESPETSLPGLIDVSGSQFADVLEGVAIEEPRYFHQNPFAPPQPYWHLDVPGDVSLGMNADRAHRAGYTGRGIKVVMCDSGWFRHPFFTQRGYRSSPVVLGPGAANANADEVGHGTAESANIFAVAPDVEFTMVKMSFVNTIASFNAAVALAPHIISCSWGSDKQSPPLSAADQALATAIALAVRNGIIVVFSAGNGQFGFPGQHPDVISSGGAFMKPDGTFQASDYASGFASQIYPGRNSPDVCGLVGMRPRAAYIMLPLQPNDDIDRDLAAGGAYPNSDQTAPNDGWAAISGTSAAAPQIAGVCALIKQACARLTPAEVKAILKSTARDVTSGRCFNRPGMNHLAVAGPDLATGNGLVDAAKAALTARIRCLGPIRPPITPPPISPPPVRPPILPPPIRPPITPPPISPPPVRPPITPPPIRPPITPPPIAPPIQSAAIEEAPQEAIVGESEEGPLSAAEVSALEGLILESDVDLDL
jgi:subtilisin family serine protease